MEFAPIPMPAVVLAMYSEGADGISHQADAFQGRIYAGQGAPDAPVAGPVLLRGRGGGLSVQHWSCREPPG